MNALEQIKQYSTVVADTGEIGLIEKHKPEDTTTNPLLLLKAVNANPDAAYITDAIAYAQEHGRNDHERVNLAMERLAVNVGKEILGYLPPHGRVSTEVPARLSHDPDATFASALSLIDSYKRVGVDKENVLIKIAATPEGIQASEKLEMLGIHCNITLLFCLEQAIAAHQAGATLISPFVGRIRDWYMQDLRTKEPFPIDQDPGVLSVREIYAYLKTHTNGKMQIMGASFRSPGQIIGLAGCDLLTIDPDLLDELAEMEVEVPRILHPEMGYDGPERTINDTELRRAITANPMAFQLLASGIQKFDAAAKGLEDLLRGRLVA